MIPISLKLKGIYSYQSNEHFIDFQHLCDAGLFGIFGSVGSGKSTILEAISFALYGETERLNKRENRGYNMMNLKSDNLLIDFIFKNGLDDKEYRFVVKGRRNTKKFEDVKTFGREAFRKEQSEWLPISVDSVEEITGLNYINFRRTIIIPQGRFQEFLQLGDTDRTKMMKELFQLHRFDLSGKTKLIEEKNNSQLTYLEGQLQQLAEISRDKVTEIENGLELLKSEIELNTVKQKEKEKQETEFKALKELFEKISTTKKELEVLNSQKSAINTLKNQLKEYRYCQIHFKSKIERLDSIKSKSEILKKELEKAKIQLENLNFQLKKLENEFIVLKKKFDTKQDLKNKVEAYEKVIKIKNLRTESDNLQSRIRNGATALNNCIIKIEKSEETRKALKSEIRQLKDNEIDIAELAQIKAWYGELNSLEKGLKEIENQIIENHKKKENKSTEIVGLLGKVDFATDDLSASKIGKFYRTAHSELETKLEVINEELKHLKVKQELSQYSKNLRDGDACPVCGSTHHPEKMRAKGLSELNKNLEEKLNSIKNRLKKINESEKEFTVKASEFQAIEQLLSDLAGKQKEAAESFNNFKKGYVFEKKYEEDELEKEFEKAQESKVELEKLEKQLNHIELELGKEQNNKEKYQEAINQFETDLAANKAGYDILFQQIELNDIDKELKLEDIELKRKIESLTNEYQLVIKNYKTVDDKINELRPKRDNIKGIILAEEKNFEQLKVEIANNEENLNAEIEVSKYSSLNEISNVLALELNVESEETKIQAHENKLFSVNEQFNKLNQQSENKHFDNDKYILLLNELEQIKNQISQQNKELGSLEKSKNEQKAKLIEKEKLNKEFESLSLRAENIKTLKNLFKANGFVNYVSSVYLQNLVNAANDRFSKLTGQKLRLELTETNDFIIRDYLNEGKTRSVKTLSGGQTFQASLSLALALADNIQSMSKSANNFFFLDEGFGSLDKESLAVVFQSLKSLRKENRVVGVISHVEELQQEIDSYLKIENDPETGSSIIRSWE